MRADMAKLAVTRSISVGVKPVSIFVIASQSEALAGEMAFCFVIAAFATSAFSAATYKTYMAELIRGEKEPAYTFITVRPQLPQ